MFYILENAEQNTTDNIAAMIATLITAGLTCIVAIINLAISWKQIREEKSAKIDEKITKLYSLISELYEAIINDDERRYTSIDMIKSKKEDFYIYNAIIYMKRDKKIQKKLGIQKECNSLNHSDIITLFLDNAKKYMECEENHLKKAYEEVMVKFYELR